MVYLMVADYDEDEGAFYATLRTGSESYQLSYNTGASPVFRLVISDSQDEVLQCDIEEYAMRSCGGTWESWRLRAPIGMLECHVIWYSAKGEPSPLQEILGSAAPIVVSDGVLFVVRAVSSPPPAEPPIPLQREAFLVAEMQSAHSRHDQPTSVEAAKSIDASFLSRYTDEQLGLVGLTRHFVVRVYQIVREARIITSDEIARELALPKRSHRMGIALSMLVQERLIYESSPNRYSIAPPNYQPATEDVLLKTISAVCDKPGSILSDLVQATGIGSGVLSKVTRYLAAEGFIRRELVTEHIGISVRGVWRHYPAR